MPIEPTVAIGAELPGAEFTWTSSDVLLYHLALGAGARPTDPGELRYAYEEDLQVLPTFGVIAPSLRVFEPPSVSFPGVEIDLAKVLHGKQEITLHRPIPVAGSASMRTRIADVYDKGKAAVIVQESEVVDTQGTPLFTTRSSIFARGEGNFGGDRGPSDKVDVPDRAPDAVLDTPTLPQQALLYRLCGDRNPLHADPKFARDAGFPAPILHGLCTYGMVCKTIVDGVLDGDVRRVGGFSAQFAGVVYPGETLRTSVWADDNRLIVTTSAIDRGAPVLANTTLTLA
jgi:acyl dehydratase